MKKKIAFCIYSLAGGGAERVVSLLLQEFADKYDCFLILMNDTIKYEIPKNIKIHFIENSDPHENGFIKLLKLPLLGFKLKQFLENEKIDTVYSFLNRPVYISIFSKLFGSKNSIFINEATIPSKMYEDRSLQSRVNKVLIQYLYPQADKIFASSLGAKEDLIKNFRIKENMIITIYNLFDIHKIIKNSYEQIAYQSKSLIFVSVGRLDEAKNHKMLIEAVNMLHTKNVDLIILGTGHLHHELERYIKELNLSNRVKCLGFQSNPYAYMSKAFAFVFASKFEGFGNVLVEALACGLPIISTDCPGGPSEILAPNEIRLFDDKGVWEAKYGMLVRVNDVIAMSNAMQRLLDDDSLAERYKERARIRAFEFDKSILVEKYEKVIYAK